jgi:outer membrane protein assembly factor BamD (BamD/ComL family)
MRSMASRFIPLLLTCAFAAGGSAASAQQEEFVLTESDLWEHKPIVPGSPEALVLRARKALAEGNDQRARAMASAFLDKHDDSESPRRADMLLVRGDALMAMGDEYEALFDFEDIARRHPGSAAFVPALEREYTIAVAYAHGLRKKFMGTIRIIDAQDDAQEILILIQERLPGSRLAEQAGMQLADFYFDNAKLRLAAEAYDLFVLNYPQSEHIDKARQRLIESYLAEYRGPAFDESGLRDARTRLERMRIAQPALAQRLGSTALLIRIYESEALKLLATAEWYRTVNDPVSAEQTIRRLVKRYPNSIATRTALRSIGLLLADLPVTVLETAPDYAALADTLLGVNR